MTLRRRKISYPNILETRELSASMFQCECCRAEARFAIQYETGPTAPVSVIYLCASHEGLARRRLWARVFSDQDKKIDSMEHGL